MKLMNIEKEKRNLEMEIIFGDSYRDIYQSIFEIEKPQILETINNPDYSQELLNGTRLFLKNYQDFREYGLLVATYRINKGTLFGYAYKVPEEIVKNNI